MRSFQTFLFNPAWGKLSKLTIMFFQRGWSNRWFSLSIGYSIGPIFIFQGWRFAKNKEYHGKIREKMWGPPLGEYPVAVCSLKIPPYPLYKRYTAGTWWYKVGVLLEGVPTFSIWEDHCCPSPSKLSWPEMGVEFRLTAIVFCKRLANPYLSLYTPVNWHSNGKWTLWRCISYWRWGYFIAMLVYQRVL